MRRLRIAHGLPRRIALRPVLRLFAFPACDGTHGAHEASGAPLGVPADKETRQLRIVAHTAFDAARLRLVMSRRESYGWLQILAGKREDEAHLGMFTAEDCHALIAVLTTPSIPFVLVRSIDVGGAQP